MKIIKNRKPIFMVHKHHATKLHYDLRLEIGGKLKSFAMYELPIKPSEPVNAVQVPDHPFWYRHFEGVIPEGDYGAGPVMVWDKGLFSSFMKDHDGKAISLEESIKKGFMLLWLKGHKLNGGYILVRLSKKAKWLIIKMDDEYVIKGRKPANWQRSVKSNKTLDQILEHYSDKLKK
ncbi:MAG: DNA polymerase ligase N-terminal domain-containing protein [Candidatus Babeliales bacterium]|nr:DNA polymerase ligase N-terminal domain-containing protein [Candidatus Babeliales bacterium]